MIASIIIVGLSIIGMFTLLVLHPEIKIGNFCLDTFFIAPLLGAIAVLSFGWLGLIDYSELGASLIGQSSINPLQILVLFLSMSFLSIVLDEAGFFSFIAAKVALKAKNSQFMLFLLLYILTSVLTTFTSNDIVILTFTPFIIFFAKHAKINPIPYLVSEFVAANSWSILFLIGNPTNIYLGESFRIGFFEYFSKMWLAAVLAGLIGFFAMLLVFHKMLKAPFSSSVDKPVLKNPFLAYLALTILIITIVSMALTDFFSFPMWLVSMSGALFLLVVTFVYELFKKKGFGALGDSFVRLPYSVIPFLLSMFILVTSLKNTGVISSLATALTNVNPYLGVGFSSYLAANFLNNIPMSVFYTEIFRSMGGTPYTMIYLAIISSNIGAFLTPVGALAGVMWTSILKNYKVQFGFKDYFRYLSPISLLSLAGAFLGYFLLTI
jgi:arsenical pump membrane protein